MIIREKYIKEIRSFYDDDLIKIITGVRRSGKSVIMEQIMDEVKEAGKNVIYLNFEDESTIRTIPDCPALIDYIEKNRKPGKNYIFLDEIHEVKDWQLACKTIRLSDSSLFITGSNSKLLSREYTKSFSGRYVSFRIRPFVYKEALEYSKECGFDLSVSDYLVWGGFPRRFDYDDTSDRRRYLEELKKSIIQNDLINRYRIDNTELFKRVVDFVLLSNSRIVSARSIEAYLKNEHIEGSINTIIKYIGYLEDAYIIDRIKPYSTKTKSELSYYFKIYDADVALNSIYHYDNRYDLTHNLENIVYNELVYMGYKVYVYNNESGKEIDFFVQKEGKEYYIQVAYSVAESEAYEREFGVFASMDNSVRKVLITNDEIDYSTSTVEHIRLKDFLLADSLERQ